MLNKWKQMVKNQKGFTLVEILVVIVIIGILFTLLVPKLDFANNKARESGVKTAFGTFRTGSEGYFRENAAVGMTQDAVNTYLDKAMQVPTGSTAFTGTATTVNSAADDPWGTAYELEFRKVNSQTASIIYRSKGKTGTATYFGATYYKNGQIESCVSGFGASQDTALSILAGNVALRTGSTTDKCGGAIS